MADSYSAIYNRYYDVADGTPVVAKIGGEMFTTAVAHDWYRITINQPSGINYDGMAVDFMINNSLVGTGIWQRDKYVPVILTLTVSGSLGPTPMPTPPPQYHVTVSANPIAGGQVCYKNSCGWSSSVSAVSYGTQLTFTETPSSGYQFVSWSGDVASTNPSITITVDSDKNIVANFVGIQYTVTAFANPSTEGLVNPPTANVNYDDPLTLIATPFRGYQLASWSGLTGYGTSLQVSFIVRSNMVVAANFEPIPFTERQTTIGAGMGVGFPPINMTAGQILEGSVSVTSGNDTAFYIQEGFPNGTIVLPKTIVQSTYSFSITAQSDGTYSICVENDSQTVSTTFSIKYRVY